MSKKQTCKHDIEIRGGRILEIKSFYSLAQYANDDGIHVSDLYLRTDKTTANFYSRRPS